MAYISKFQKPKPKIIVPSVEQLQIGEDANGHPIWVETRDLINTAADNEALAHNKLKAANESALQKMVAVVLENATRFTDETFRHVAPRSVIQKADDGDMREWERWINEVGFHVIQDGLKTVVKMSGRVIREMDANVDKRFAEDVARRVNGYVKLPQGK